MHTAALAGDEIQISTREIGEIRSPSGEIIGGLDVVTLRALSIDTPRVFVIDRFVSDDEADHLVSSTCLIWQSLHLPYMAIDPPTLYGNRPPPSASAHEISLMPHRLNTQISLGIDRIERSTTAGKVSASRTSRNTWLEASSSEARVHVA